MKFVIADYPGFPFMPPSIIEQHEGTEEDARRVLSQWMNDDDTIWRQEVDGLVILHITADGEIASDIVAVFKSGAA